MKHHWPLRNGRDCFCYRTSTFVQFTQTMALVTQSALTMMKAFRFCYVNWKNRDGKCPQSRAKTSSPLSVATQVSYHHMCIAYFASNRIRDVPLRPQHADAWCRRGKICASNCTPVSLCIGHHRSQRRQHHYHQSRA